MHFPRWYARWNRFATNKLVRLWAGWVPGMGLLRHTGRRSGRLFRTPLNVFPTGSGFAVLLPYGPKETEWLKNVEAAGETTLQRYGRARRVSRPQVLPRLEAAPEVVPRWRFIFARAPFADALLLHAD
jgi:deazaflavin-dependent oxidoreductase (nitroreductase family)